MSQKIKEKNLTKMFQQLANFENFEQTKTTYGSKKKTQENVFPILKFILKNRNKFLRRPSSIISLLWY